MALEAVVFTAWAVAEAATVEAGDTGRVNPLGAPASLPTSIQAAGEGAGTPSGLLAVPVTIMCRLRRSAR